MSRKGRAQAMLEARNLTLWRGETCLFDRLSLHVPAGSVLLVRGPNGVGKTTLLRVLCGLTRPESGQVLWEGRDDPLTCRRLVAYGGHQSALKADLTVRQNLRFYRRLVGDATDESRLLELLSLSRCADLEARHLSAGQRRRAGLARILVSGRPAWLLDEPFTNMDSDGRRLLEARITSHVVAGGIAVVVAHDEVRLSGIRVETLNMADS